MLGLTRRRAARRLGVATALMVALTACTGASGGTAAAPASTPAPSGPAPTSALSATPTTATTPTTAGPTASGSPTTPTTRPATTPTADPTPGASTSPATASGPRPLRPGARGTEVRQLQQRLGDLGYWLGTPDGVFGDLTRQAVIALQKTAGLGRDGVVGPKTRAALDKGVRPDPRSTRGRVIEVDLKHQVLMVVDDGSLVWALNTSTGSGRTYTQPDGDRVVATTPTGKFSVSWQVDGWRTSDLGRLYRPKYFHRWGIAVHGYPSVPAHPASHGCVRVSLPAMDMIWSKGLMPLKTPVWVY